MREEPAKILTPEEVVKKLQYEVVNILEGHVGLWAASLEPKIRQLLQFIEMDARANKKTVPTDKIREVLQIIRKAFFDNKLDYASGDEPYERRRARREIEWCIEVLTALVIGIDMAQAQETNRSDSVEP